MQILNTDLDNHVLNSELKDIIKATLSEIPPRLSLLIIMRFGLGEEDAKSFPTIAKDWKISTTRVRQLYARAMRILSRKIMKRKLRGVFEC